MTETEASDSLREVQARLLEVLRVVDEVCREHGLQYWLDGGTLLGAIRHDGFIPWDDDIDIAIDREHFRALMQLLPARLPLTCKLQTGQGDGVVTSAKIWLMNIEAIDTYTEKYLQQDPRTHASLDIFAMDPQVRGRLTSPLLRWTSFAATSHEVAVQASQSRAFKLRKRLRWKALSMVPRSVSGTLSQQLLRASRNRGYSSITYGIDTQMYGSVTYPRSVVFPVAPISFEGLLVSGPAKPHQYLTRHYGDYWTVPPPSDRHSHLRSFRILDPGTQSD